MQPMYAPVIVGVGLEIWLALLVQVIALIGGAIGLIAVLRKQEATHILINSRLDQLLKITAEKSLAEGRALGPIVIPPNP
jgi:hypothetical protein